MRESWKWKKNLDLIWRYCCEKRDAAEGCCKEYRKREKDILFIDAGLEYEKGKNQNRLRDEDIEKICDAYKNRKDIEKYSKKASIEEIRENEYNLNISRYIDSFEDEERINLKSIIKEIHVLEKENTKLNNKLENILKDIKL